MTDNNTQNHRMPLVMLSGFLGAGKTTLLRHILESKDMKYTVGLIVNDVADVNVDAALVRKTIQDQEGTQMVQMQNGCACCSASDDLYKSIRKLLNLKQFDYIVVECSGVAEPKRMYRNLEMIIEEEGLENTLQLSHIVTVVDASRVLKNILVDQKPQNAEWKSTDRFVSDLFMEQIESGDILVINKTDLVEDSELCQIRQILEKITPSSRIYETTRGVVNVNDILFANKGPSVCEMSTDEEHRATLRHALQCNHPEEAHECQPGAKRRKMEHPKIQTYVYRRRLAFDTKKFDDHMIKNKPAWFSEKVLRSKGFCWFKDRMDMAFFWSQAGSYVSLSPTGAWWDVIPRSDWPDEGKDEILVDFEGEFGDRRQEIVFIGFDLDSQAIDAILDPCLVNLQGP